MKSNRTLFSENSFLPLFCRNLKGNSRMRELFYICCYFDVPRTLIYLHNLFTDKKDLQRQFDVQLSICTLPLNLYSFLDINQISLLKQICPSNFITNILTDYFRIKLQNHHVNYTLFFNWLSYSVSKFLGSQKHFSSELIFKVFS